VHKFVILYLSWVVSILIKHFDIFKLSIRIPLNSTVFPILKFKIENKQRSSFGIHHLLSSRLASFSRKYFISLNFNCLLLDKHISSLIMHVINSKTHLGGEMHFQQEGGRRSWPPVSPSGGALDSLARLELEENEGANLVLANAERLGYSPSLRRPGLVGTNTSTRWVIIRCCKRCWRGTRSEQWSWPPGRLNL
jgi:hypothetical protein